MDKKNRGGKDGKRSDKQGKKENKKGAKRNRNGGIEEILYGTARESEKKSLYRNEGRKGRE